MSGPSHGSPVVLALWKANDQRSSPARAATSARRLEQLLAVGVAGGQDPLRQRVRGEDHPGVGAAHAVGHDLHERRVVVPALDQDELGLPPGERRLEPLAVARRPTCASSAVRARRRSASSRRPRAPVPPPRRSAAASASSRRRPARRARARARPAAPRSPRRAASARRSAGSARRARRRPRRRPAARRACPRSTAGCPRASRGCRTPSGSRHRSSRGHHRRLVHQPHEPTQQRRDRSRAARRGRG